MSTQAPSESKVEAHSRRVAVARLRAAAPRHLFLAATLILIALGLRGLFWAPEPPAPATVRSASAPSEDFALRFARAYLAYDADRPQLRERALAPFLGAALDSEAGMYAPIGARRVLWAQVASDQRALAGGRVITVAAGLSGRPDPAYLAVTVRHDRRRGLALGGYPALVGAPALDPEPGGAKLVAVEQADVATVAERALRNYLAGSVANLRADLDRGAAVSLPSEPLAVRDVEQLGWIGAAESGAVLITLSAQEPGGLTYTLSYELGIERRERPYVSFIQVIPTES